MKAHRTLRGLAVAVSLAGVIAVSGCGTANTAAVVDGRTITVSEAQEAAAQINEAFNLQDPLTTTAVLTQLIYAPYVLDVAEKAGKAQSESVARAKMPNLREPSEATLLLVRANAALDQQTAQGLDQAQQGEVLAAIEKAKITVSPRFGTFNTAQVSLQPSSPNWFAASNG